MSFSPPKRFVWLSETLVNPFRDCQHSALLYTPRFHVFTLPHFAALIFHCFGPSLLWLLISDYPSPVLSRRYNFSPPLTSLLATSRCCVRPPTLIQSETSFFLLHCCILSTPWSITVWLADGSCRFTCVVGLIGAWSVTCFSSLSSSFHSLSRVSVPFNRCIQSPKTLSCVGFTRLLTVISHHPTTDFATVFVHFDSNSPP